MKSKYIWEAASASNDFGLGNVIDRKLVEAQDENKIYVHQTGKVREKETIESSDKEEITKSPLQYSDVLTSWVDFRFSFIFEVLPVAWLCSLMRMIYN